MSRNLGQPTFALLSALFLAGGVAAMGTEANPYQGIAVRNAFNLKPIEVAPKEEVIAKPPSSIKLSGIVSYDGITRALIVLQDGAKSENLPPLTEGAQEGQIRVLKIDEAKGVVEILNGSARTRINFEDNKLAAIAPVAPGGAGGTNGPASMKPGSPVSPSNLPPSVSSRMSSRGDRGEGPRSGGGGPAGTVPVPTRSLRTSQSMAAPEAPTHVAPIPESNLTATESVVLLEVQREVNKDKVEAKQLPPFPPSPF